MTAPRNAVGSVHADPAVESDQVAAVVARGRAAMAEVSTWNQDQIDGAVVAIGWSLYRQDHAEELARLAVGDTGLGNVADKIIKNRRKTFGTLRDLLRLRSVGALDDAPVRGVTRYGKPVGVVGAVTPSTNPSATPINNAMMAVKGANAIVLAPSPAGWATTARAVEHARSALAEIGAPPDLVQVLPDPVTRAATNHLMELVDLVVATGSQRNVNAAYRSGTPAIGVGAGNVPVIVDESADLADAARKIGQSKTFDNATSCSSENSLVVLDSVYESLIAELESVGAYRATRGEVEAIEQGLFPDGTLNRDLVAVDYSVLRATLGLAGPPDATFVLAEQAEPAAGRPLTGEKLSLVLTVYRATTLDHAIELCRRVLDYQGIGHSVGIHTGTLDVAHRLGRELPVVRVIVNQAHTFGNGGSFDNGMPFTLSMGCGTWAGNSISENLNGAHFINVTHVVTTIDADEPTEREIFGAHWERQKRG